MSDEELALEEQEGADVGAELSDEEKFLAKLKDTVIVEQEEIGSLRRRLTVTVPRETVDERMGEQLAELRRDAIIPGFRKGHAPIRLVEKRFATDVGDQLKSQLVGRGYMAAVEKMELKPLGDPLVWVRLQEERTDEQGLIRKVDADRLLSLERALDHITLPKEGPLTFSCEVELKPEFELPSLDKIPVKKPIVAIDDDDVDNELKRTRMIRGTFKPVEDGEIETDDLLYADLKMIVDGDVLLNEQNVDLAARDVRIKGVPLTGLGDVLVGKKRDDTVMFEASVPDDHENAEIRGKSARFEFTVREVKRLEVPPIDAEFLAQVGYDSEDELRSAVRSQLESQLDRTMHRLMRDQVADYLVGNTVLEIPEGLSQRQTERSIARRVIEMYQKGVPEPEIEKAVDELRSKAHAQTVRDLKLFFILEKIADDREIEVHEEEVNAAIAEMAQQTHRRFDRVRDDLSKGDGMLSLYLTLRDTRALESLLETADVTEEEGPKKKVSKKSVKTVGEQKKLTQSKPDKAEGEKPSAAARTSSETETTKPGPKKTTRKKGSSDSP